MPADADDIVGEYRTLLSELEKYNPELMEKQRILAISKSDLLDDELEEEMRAELTKDAPGLNPLFFSSVAQRNLTLLKDQIWKAIDDANPDTGLSVPAIQVVPVGQGPYIFAITRASVHRRTSHRQRSDG